MNKVLTVIKSRRSIRRYLPRRIKAAELQAVLEAGLYAPSAHNEQSWHFTVVRNKDLIDRMSALAKAGMAGEKTDWVKAMGTNEKFHLFYGAPVVIVVSMRRDALSPLVDCSAAIENMLIAAESLDLGTCWIGLARYYFTRKEARARLKIPAGYEPCYAVALGYKDQRPARAPQRKAGAVNYID